mmetsp:Transcript_951/g.1073  ORF Transcript_951/g.1073 Transcript_951/m.1073 type:complete len:747 (+) Transcript_951:101-2341(+)
MMSMSGVGLLLLLMLQLLLVAEQVEAFGLREEPVSDLLQQYQSDLTILQEEIRSTQMQQQLENLLELELLKEDDDDNEEDEDDDDSSTKKQIRGDWGRPQNFFTVFNATLFAFVIQLIPALIFAELMDRETEGNLATAETLLSSAIIGIIYALFSGQPLVIMGITGPVSLLLGTSYGLAAQFNASYFPFFFWLCVWAGVMHLISAMVGLVSLVWKVTPFTSQIFELFIAITFIYSSLRDLLVPIHLSDNPVLQEDMENESGLGGAAESTSGMPPIRIEVTSAIRSAGYASFFIGLLTCYIAWSLHFAETWLFFSKQVRIFLTSYNTLIAVVVATAISYVPGIDQAAGSNESSSMTKPGIERVNVVAPWDWEPTADRSWVVHPLEGIGWEGIVGALIPGFMFFLLFIIDHNVSSILTQSPKFNLVKPPAYHWDFFVLGLTFFPCAILGLPPGNGLIPQAPLHARALCTRKIIIDRHGVKREVVTYCEEQRWSALGQAILMFVALSLFVVIEWIPTGSLFGLLLYLGMTALHGNEIWERLLLCFVYAHKRPKIPVVRYVSQWRTVQLWTLIQLVCALTIWAVGQYATWGYIYPLLLTLLVPFRSFVLDRCFASTDLQHLDPQNETEEEFHEEQKMVHHALIHDQGSVDEEDVAFTTRAEFHPQGMKRALKEKDKAAHDHRRHTIGGGTGTSNGVDGEGMVSTELAQAGLHNNNELQDPTTNDNTASEKTTKSPSVTDLMALNDNQPYL